MSALANQEIVDRTQHRTETVWIGHPPFVPSSGAAISDRLALTFDRTFEQAAFISSLEFAKFIARKVVGKSVDRSRKDCPGESAFGA